MTTLNGQKTSIVLIILLTCLLAAFAGAMFTEKPEWAFRLFGLSEKFRILNFLGGAMGGILIAIQAVLSYKRAKALEDAADSQARATAEHS